MRPLLMIIFLIGVVISIVGRSPSSPTTSAEVPSGNSSLAGVESDSPDLGTSQPAEGTVELQRTGDGHFYADVEVNGTPIHMLVDTGASGVALSREDAHRAGIATSIGMPDVIGQGADGSVHGEFVTIDHIALGEKAAEQLPAMVLENGQQSLLGQSFLQKFASVEIQGDTMTLR